MKKMETLTSLVSAYAIRVDRKRMSRRAKYMTTVLESGLRKLEAIRANTAKLRKYAAMKIMRWVISTPKKSMTNPTRNKIVPNMS
jgi:hypothetical protein